jgi:glycosyltransferase involved in cell wall biosynthesis
VLHYLGYNEDHGGIVAVVRALTATGRMRGVLGMNAGAIQRQSPPLPLMEFPALSAESHGLSTAWRALAVARQARLWLRADADRVFHGHSRAGLWAVLWLRLLGERRVLASVHAFGTGRFLYRSAAALLGRRLYWLSPAMKQYYGLGTGTWEECLPDCIAPPRATAEHRPPTGILRLGVVGPLEPCKRWDLVLAALARLPAETRGKVRLVQAGAVVPPKDPQGHDAAMFRLAETLGVTGLIEWRGWVRPLDNFWAEIDCLLVPSPIEAFSVAAVEALAAGVPVMASDASGTRDLVTATRGGWLFPGESPDALAAAIARLVDAGRPAGWRPDAAGLQRFIAPVAVEQYLAAYARLERTRASSA